MRKLPILLAVLLPIVLLYAAFSEKPVVAGEAAEAVAPKGPPVEKVVKSEEEWKKLLTDEQFYVLRRAGTERAGSSPLDKEHRRGAFVCAACGLELFRSEDKFDSGTGWPSFTRPYFLNNVEEHTDYDLGMARTEIRCARCGGHIGHVFADGPKPTGLRYCMNGDALKFVPAKE
jgi:peptide-methionine (R)-S-oxide reductase